MSAKVLVVDDVAFARRLISEILTAAGYVVAGEASNGDEAIKMYQTLRPDVVSMDLIMPIKGGIEATRSILAFDKEAKIIMVSGMSHEQFLMESITAGARDYLLKPFSADDLVRCIDKVVKTDEEDSAEPVSRGVSHGA